MNLCRPIDILHLKNKKKKKKQQKKKNKKKKNNTKKNNKKQLATEGFAKIKTSSFCKI